MALRAELSPAQRRELTLGIAQALADRYGTAGTLAVHTPDREGDQRNHHAHILMTTRRLEPSGALGEKTRELDDVKRGPLGTVTRLQANNDRRQLTADRAELGAVSAQIIDIEQALAERAAREQATGAASAGMEAFKARFQQSQDVAARIEAERARLTAEAQRVARSAPPSRLPRSGRRNKSGPRRPRNTRP